MARYIFPAGSVTSTGTRQRLVPYLSTTDETPETEIAYVRGATETGKGRQSIVTDESGAYTAFVGPEGASTLHLERPNGTRVSVASSTATTDTTLAGASASALAADPAFTGTYALKGGGDAICMGDSITSYGGSETMAPSWFNHLCVRSLGRLRWRGSYATGGFKIADLIATHVPQVLAMTPKPGTAFIMIAANDCSENNGVGFNVAAKSADYVSGVLAPLQAAGIRVIPVMVTPNDGANGGAPQITANVDLWNAWLRRYCQANGLLCLDANSPLVDTDGSMQVAFRLGGTDHVHPSARGHKAIAEYNLPAVQSAFPPAPLGSSKWAESYNLLGNGTFATDSNSDGLADGWAVGGSPTGFTRSLVAPTAGADINGNWQQVTRATTDTNAAWIYKQISSGWSVGDVLEYSVRVQAEGFTGSGALFSTYIKPGNLANAYGAVNSWTEDIVDGLLTVRFSVPATATTLFCYVANLTVPTSGTTEFRVAEATVRNLTTMGLAAL